MPLQIYDFRTNVHMTLKTNLDIFWLKDDSLEDTENLPAPEVLAQEIVEQLEAALEEFRSVEAVLAGNGAGDG